jgi:hypothetical protein
MPTDPLLRIFDIVQPSLAMFLADCGLWTYPGPEEARLALADLVADQRNLLDRAAVVIEEREQARPRMAYPISFTAWHDINLRHILPRVIENLERQRSALEEIAETPDDAAAADVATDALRSLRQHLDVFRDMMTTFRRQAAPHAAPAESAMEPPAATAAAS